MGEGRHFARQSDVQAKAIRRLASLSCILAATAPQRSGERGMSQKLPKLDGLRSTPKTTAGGAARPGRFACHDVQWTGGAGSDPLLGTFTITADELAESATSNLL